jgi:NAD+ kinase
MLRILVVAKQPVLDRFSIDDLTRLRAAGVGRELELQRGKRRHDESLRIVTAALSGHRVDVARIDQLSRDLVLDRDLVVTVGGDGTVLATHCLLDGTPLLAVNSDPEHSLGHFTRCHAAGFDALFAQWCAGAADTESMFRLQVCTAGCPPAPVLNECLVTNQNPALMSRYVLRNDQKSEEQYSSGLWVSTPAGSTGAIASAGMLPQPELDAALLYKVREPFPGRGPFALLEEVQQPPQGLDILPTISGMACYLDGGYRLHFDLELGQWLRIEPCPEPLRLVVPGS